MTDPPPIRQVYDRIGEHFSKTREYPWTDVTAFLEGQSGTLGLDVGCGNGRHTEALAEVVDRPVGLDLSRTLLEEAQGRAADRSVAAIYLQGTATALPIMAATVDVGLYVAAIHHLRTREARIESLDELARVLAPGGTALVSSWSTAHETFDREQAFETTVDWTLPGGETVPRYYYIYDPDTFAADLAASALAVEERWVAAGNNYAVVTPRR